MRVYDFSKKYDVAIKNIISALKERGVRRAEANFSLTDAHTAFLKKKFRVRDAQDDASNKIVVSAEISIKDTFLGELSVALGRPASEIIVFLLKKGIVANKNQLLKKDVVLEIVNFYGATPVEDQREEAVDGRVQDSLEVEQAVGDARAPIVAVVGHVDHGKTTLLDTIRKTRVAAKEAGGITQSIGAYSVETSHGDVVFIDTPGHEAFSVMRERGVKVADIVALIVAADDGVMPQTIECIKAIKALEVPVIVIVNKIDKVDEARLEVVKRQLSEHGVLSDEWGGDVPFAYISAQSGQGVTEMLDLLALQADMLHLSANFETDARGYVLESNVQKGRGPVASLILHCGKLKVGDYFTCGQTTGKVSSMEDSFGKRIKEAGPSNPVIVAGFEELPAAGDLLKISSQAGVKKHKNSIVTSGKQKKVDASVDAINIIIKASSCSSKEALEQAIAKIDVQRAKPVRVIESGVGDINVSNIEMAENTDSAIFGLDVKIERNATALKSSASIKSYNVIYRLIDDIKAIVEETREPEYKTTFLGRARVKAVFRIKSVGVVAGAAVEEGVMQSGASLIVSRGGKQLAEGPILSLQKDKSTVDSVAKGFDCAFRLKEFEGWKIGDEVECILKEEVK